MDLLCHWQRPWEIVPLPKLLCASPAYTLTFPGKAEPPGPVIPWITQRRSPKSQILAFVGELEALQGSGLLCSPALAAPAELPGSPVGVGEDLKTIIVLYFSSLLTKQSCPLPPATIFSSCSHGAGGERKAAAFLPHSLSQFPIPFPFSTGS